MKGVKEDLKKYRAEEKELIAKLEHVQEVIGSLEGSLSLEEPKKPRGSKKKVQDEAPQEQEEDVFA